MMLSELRDFIGEHSGCGELVGDATPATAQGYLLWVACTCGVRFERWVTEDAAVEEMVFSGLLVDRN